MGLAGDGSNRSLTSIRVSGSLSREATPGAPSANPKHVHSYSYVEKFLPAAQVFGSAAVCGAPAAVRGEEVHGKPPDFRD